uniref:Myomaker, myoblast fusion factor n=1 Tax=Denticeps clupeoides TaxID=299321 RepID=A0AAY4DWG4_9TELE
MLLPTISSLAFLPAASVATKRGFHMEAMVYFFTMFFTAVSVLPLTLEYLSVYSTAISNLQTSCYIDAASREKQSITSFRIIDTKDNTGQFRKKLGYKLQMFKGIYPEKSVYTQQVGPGCCFGALALMLRFYFEEWDCAYVHSLYHLSMAETFWKCPSKKAWTWTGKPGLPFP